MSESSEMDLSEEIQASKVCYERKENVLDNLKISNNESNSMLVFWNKYQIFIHENFNLDGASKVLNPEFLISQVIVSNNYLLSLANDGNIHVISLKFKNNDQKRFKSSFQPKAQNVLNIIQYSSNTVLSLKKESQTYSFCVHKIDSSFDIKKETFFKLEQDYPVTQNTQEKTILLRKLLTESEFNSIKDLLIQKIFHTKESWHPDTSFVIVSFDSINVYGCIHSTEYMTEKIELVELYKSPTEICDISIQQTGNVNLIIGLKCGTIIRLRFEDMNKIHDIIHLNTAIHKFIALKDSTLLYSDGITMWKSENTYTKSEITFQKLFVKQPKDFMKIGEKIICTTYLNMIYRFSIENKDCYEIKTEIIDEYYPAEQVMKNSECLKQIMQEIEKNKTLIRKVNEENNHITALSLSKRPDIMNKVIENEITVYESYKEVIQENKNITLTEKLSKYFEPGFLFLIRITANLMQQTLNEVLSNLLADTKIHISFSTENKLLKTTSIKLAEPLKNVQYLVPIKSDEMIDSTEIKVNIKLVLNLPGCMDAKQTVWTVLYENESVLHSEHFIKTSKDLKVDNLTEPKENIAELIKKTAIHEHGNLFDFSEIPKPSSKEWSLYVKLPENFKQILQKDDCLKSKFSETKAKFLHKNFSSEEFLKSKHKLTFEIGAEKVKLEIIDDFCSPMVEVSSVNMKLAFNIRNFLVNLIYNDFKDCGPGKEFVKFSLYTTTTTENLQKAVKKSLASGSQEELLSLAEQFQKSVIGSFPL